MYILQHLNTEDYNITMGNVSQRTNNDNSLRLCYYNFNFRIKLEDKVLSRRDANHYRQKVFISNNRKLFYQLFSIKESSVLQYGAIGTDYTQFIKDHQSLKAKNFIETKGNYQYMLFNFIFPSAIYNQLMPICTQLEARYPSKW